MTLLRYGCRTVVKLLAATCAFTLVIVTLTFGRSTQENKSISGLTYRVSKLELELKEIQLMTRQTSIGNTSTEAAIKLGDPVQMKVAGIKNQTGNSDQPAPLFDYVAFPCTERLPPFPEVNQAERGRCVRTINGSHHADTVTSQECVTLNTPSGTTPICIHDTVADHWVSKSLKTSGGWEYSLVNKMCKKLLAYPDIEFLDLGCNIGVYSLSVARTGRRAICVDPLIRNLQLVSKSLTLGNLRENVTLIWNAVSNDYREVGFLMEKGNIGGTAIQDVNANMTSGQDYRVKTIRLDDLTPLFKGKQLGIKIDVERHELNLLEGGTAFFDQVEVRFIQMEIMFHKVTPFGPRIVDYFAGHNFTAYGDINGGARLQPDKIKSWPNDVYFIKADTS